MNQTITFDFQPSVHAAADPLELPRHISNVSNGPDVEAIKQLVDAAEQVLGRKVKVGIGTPGAVSSVTDWLKNSNSICLNGKPIVEDLESVLKRKIVIANDANCFALSEAVDGNASDGRVVFGVIVGTGTGGGIVIDKNVLTGVNSIAGEWGHNPMPNTTTAEREARPCPEHKTSWARPAVHLCPFASEHGPYRSCHRCEAHASERSCRWQGKISKELGL